MKMCLLFLVLAPALLQSRGQTTIPTTGIFTRVLLLEYGKQRGSVFSIVIDSREYWITAKHVITGAEHGPYGTVTQKQITARILNPSGPGEDWLTETFALTDPGDNIDIVILTAPHALLNVTTPSLQVSEAALFGGDCAFLGYPYGAGWRTTYQGGSSWLPYTKRCTISAKFDASDGENIWVLDGINNKGFSGGPVIYGTGANQAVMAVISGYYTESLEVTKDEKNEGVVGKQEHSPNRKKQVRALINTKESVQVNSGFIVAYGINAVVKAIRANANGPLVQ